MEVFRRLDFNRKYRVESNLLGEFMLNFVGIAHVRTENEAIEICSKLIEVGISFNVFCGVDSIDFSTRPDLAAKAKEVLR